MYTQQHSLDIHTQWVSGASPFWHDSFNVSCQLCSDVGISCSTWMVDTPIVQRHGNAIQLQEVHVSHAHHLSGGVQTGHVLQVGGCLIVCENPLPLNLQREHLDDDCRVVVHLVDLQQKSKLCFACDSAS